jgi:hypothetical protein
MKKRGPQTQTKTIEDILENTEREGDCRLWVGGKHVQGYGMMRQNGVMRSVHSVVAELKYGRKPTKYGGERVTRTCDNVDCVNPDHIVIKSASDIRCGIFPRQRTLSMEVVRDIRKEYAKGDWGRGTRIAKKHNISTNMVYAIAAGRIYKELPE